MLEKLKDAAIKDPLTKPYNRRHFYDVGQKMFAEAERDDANLTVTMIDVDFFKKINDRYGHDGGDVALKHLSGILSGALGSGHLLARFGGGRSAFSPQGCPPMPQPPSSRRSESGWRARR